MEGWANFFVAEVGAAAALSGLLTVAISINLTRILAHPHLPGRAAETLTVLVGSLLVCSLALMPGQPIQGLGAEAFVIGLALTALPIAQRSWAVPNAEGQPIPHLGVRLVLTFLPAIPFPIGGAMLMAGSSSGLYVIAVGVLLGFVGAAINAWVLLVEILR